MAVLLIGFAESESDILWTLGHRIAYAVTRGITTVLIFKNLVAEVL